jgi:hypothetical protein
MSDRSASAEIDERGLREALQIGADLIGSTGEHHLIGVSELIRTDGPNAFHRTGAWWPRRRLRASASSNSVTP